MNDLLIDVNTIDELADIAVHGDPTIRQIARQELALRGFSACLTCGEAYEGTIVQHAETGDHKAAVRAIRTGEYIYTGSYAGDHDTI